jgi:hypothetical protein
VVLSAYKDLLCMLYDIRELEVMLVPIKNESTGLGLRKMKQLQLGVVLRMDYLGVQKLHGFMVTCWKMGM